MFGMFGRKARQAGKELAKIENRDLAQAAVYGCFFVASADGELEKEELDKVDRLLRNSPQLQHFGAELGNLVDRAKADFTEGGSRIIRMNAERELRDLASNKPDAEVVLNFMLTVAEADGEIEDAEQKVLERAANCMDLRLQDYL
jgi:tellurite resistance protein TerB